ncbi:unnamed protein product [Caenorhabditis angaria]|uniref:Tr-type G domain-containing protein n=1 Tax=Caenorhabditis angaria TaxID=860376 RepID=A0A9P1I713_9PELO|nr:unnamed protein product [Caenorhabditis angaria]
MSRHRNVRNMNYADEIDDYDEDYDDDYSEDDDEGTSAQYSYKNRKAETNLSANYYTYAAEPDAPVGAPKPTPSTSIVRNSTAPSLTTNFVKEKEKVKAVAVAKSNNSTPKRNLTKNNLLVEATASQTPSRPNSEVDLSAFRRNQLQTISRAPAQPRKPQKSRENVKDLINLIVVGHVDAGKSTLMGHLLYEMEFVDSRTMEKYKHEAARSGKSSFAYAWVLDETEEERERGVTMDVARVSFETDTKRICLLDAPGHKDFISNMITGTSQADAAILVINGTRGEFETGFENGGQTKEHALLLRSLGVTQLIVAVNKLDTVDWSRDRFEEIKNNLSVFLTKQAGFANPRFIPVSGLSGENLTKKTTEIPWFNGPCLLESIDSFVAAKLPISGPLRIVVSDVLKVQSAQLILSGKIESGEIEKDDKVYIMPSVTAATVKACSNTISNTEQCLAGDHVLLTLAGTFEPDSIQTGSVVVRAGPDTLIPARRFLVRLVVFDILTPIIKGSTAELYAHSICVSCTFSKLNHSINKSNGEILKLKPRFLAKGTSAIVEIETDQDVAIEPFTKCRSLGRVTFRSGGKTIAAGIVENVL